MAADSVNDPLLSPEFLRRLERLQLSTRRVFRAGMRGERRSHRKGVSIEFADYRDYVRGDDLRFIDWNIYGRLDRLLLKLFLEEQDLYFYILLDVSQSMDWGAVNKLRFAKRIAAALAYIGLTNHDRIGIVAISAQGMQVFNPASGRHSIWRLFQFLEALQPAGQTDLHARCREFALKFRRRGIVALITDFLDPGGYEEAVKMLMHGNNEVYLVHTLADEELDPEIRGHLDLIDVETDDHAEITVSPQMLQVYKRTVNAYCSQIRALASRYGINYLLTPTSTNIEQLVLSVLRARGLVK